MDKPRQTKSALRARGALLAILVAALLVAAGSSAPAPASALAPDRGLELVTPEAPGPAVTAVEHIRADGRAVVYQSLGPFPGAAAGDIFSYNLAVRGEKGWVTKPLGLPYTVKEPSLFITKPVAFDSTLTTSLWLSPLPLTPDGPPDKQYGLYHRFPDGSLQTRLALGEEEPTVVDASSDAGHLVFEYPGHLLPSDAARASGSGIYELIGSSLRQVDIDAGGQGLSPCGADAERQESVSESGARIVFSARPVDCSQPLRLYVRDGGSHTIEVSESNCTRPDCNSPQDVTFVGATPSVSHVFMVTSQQLTDDDEDGGPDLYRRSLVGGELKLLTPEVAGADGEVLPEALHASADGSRAYFYARGRLVPGGGANGRTNLYLWQGDQLRFMIPLRTDQPLATTGDGRYALLTAQAPLSGSDFERQLLFSFDGSDTTAGKFGTVTRIGIDQSSGHVYVLDNGHDVIDKFNAEGVAVPFASTGTSSLSGAATPATSLGLNGEADISIDNSGTASQGRIYANAEFGPVNAFAPNGEYLWQLPAAGLGDDCGTAVDSLGHLWVVDWSKQKAFQYATTGTPPAQIGSVESTTGNPCRINLDRQGDLYFNIWSSRVDRYKNGLFDSTLNPSNNRDIAIDQSRDDGLLFTIHSDSFGEYTADGGLLGSSGTGLIENGTGIAYNPQRDWVYVADAGNNTIRVFGPPVAIPVTNVPVEGVDLDRRTDVYRYDALSNRLKLVSSGSGAGDGPFDATTASPLEEGQIFGPSVTFRVLSEDGERAWFSTPERLLPEDGNEADDVYEWDSGNLYLVSGGQGEEGVEFAGASPDGATVLFRTPAVLLPADRDGGDRDIYAARIGGGFDESPPASECPSQPCRRSPVVAGVFASSATTRAGKASRGRLRIATLPRGMVAEIIRSGRTKVIVRAPAAGIVSARVLASKAVLATGVAGATRPGRVPVVLTWTAKARSQLAAGKVLKLRLRVRQGGSATTMRLALRGAERK